jgi:hypothetical protein
MKPDQVFQHKLIDDISHILTSRRLMDCLRDQAIRFILSSERPDQQPEI